ncbi:MAG: hypothetical protein LBP92_01635 [Deltaproteobacteria bacterium]|jgi:nitrogenase molybdenum-iron protein beta chain|nr:hypothetical protein [Deltaproteobacteria bacterium]
MNDFIDRPRFTCALGGALFTLRALKGVVPIIHAGSGCGYNLYLATNAGAGYLGGGCCGGAGWSSSNVLEEDIVFGGEDRLREQIKSTIDLMESELYVVVSGCSVEMIGDDIVSVAAEAAQKGYPVLAVPTPGFAGDSFTGYDLILAGLFKGYLAKGLAKRPEVVNLWGLVPGQDVFYKGNLREIKRLLSRLGIKANTFFGEGETLADLKEAGRAGLNLVLSDVYGQAAAKVFEETHGTPYLTLAPPVGALQSRAFLAAISEALGLGEDLVSRVVSEEEERYFDYLGRVADIYNDVDLQRYALVIGDANYAPAVTRFLADELGHIPALSMVTDQLGEEQRLRVAGRFQGFASGLAPAVRFDPHASSFRTYLQEIHPPDQNQRYYDGLGPAFMVGSVLERDLAAERGWPLMIMSFPATNRVVFQESRMGYDGGLNMAAELFSLLVSGR